MTVRELMTKTVACCRPETNLAAAGALLWEGDCGLLPVVNDQRKVVAVLTDRDICIALTTQDRRASAIRAGDVASSRAFVCNPEDEIQSALQMMAAERVHRLPVVNKMGILEGIISVNDIVVRAARESGRRRPVISCDDVIQALGAICGRQAGTHHRPDHSGVDQPGPEHPELDHPELDRTELDHPRKKQPSEVA